MKVAYWFLISSTAMGAITNSSALDLGRARDDSGLSSQVTVASVPSSPPSTFSNLLGTTESVGRQGDPYAKTRCTGLPQPRPPIAGPYEGFDGDEDGVLAVDDWCPDTASDPTGEDSVNEDGCALSQLDDDFDCVSNLVDRCPQSRWGSGEGLNGCPLLQKWNPLGIIEGDSAGDSLGAAVAISANGSVVAIGAPYHAWLDVPYTGQVQIFTDGGDSWALGDPDFINFGNAVALSGDGTMLAVAQGGVVYPDGGGVPSVVQVYERVSSSWRQIGEDITTGIVDDQFGHSIAMGYDGMTLAIGAPNSDGGSGNNAQRGQVRVYRLSGNTWVQLGNSINGTQEYERSGISVAISPSTGGTVVAVGTEANRARAYCLTGGNWYPRAGGAADVVGKTAEDLGRRIALSGDGDLLMTTLGTPGGVRTFRWAGGSGGTCGGGWRQEGADILGESSFFDSARVSISSDGKFLLVGSASTKYYDGAGTVRLYSRSPVIRDYHTAWRRLASNQRPEFIMGWAQIQRSLNTNLEETEIEIALSGDGRTIIIGSQTFDDGRGRALVYRLSN